MLTRDAEDRLISAGSIRGADVNILRLAYTRLETWENLRDQALSARRFGGFSRLKQEYGASLVRLIEATLRGCANCPSLPRSMDSQPARSLHSKRESSLLQSRSDSRRSAFQCF
jgi:hypothetical protein